MPVGTVFGRLTTLAPPEGRYRTVQCVCVCGRETVVQLYGLTSGGTASCGCLRSEAAARRRTHGMSKTRVYRIWAGMVSRCAGSTALKHKNYGARGITVCQRWLRFENFYADMGEPPFTGASIDRKHNDKGYSKSNCRWATTKEQSANTRRNKWYECRGQRLLLKDIANSAGITFSALYYRVNKLQEPTTEAVKHLTRNRKLNQLEKETA